MKILEIKEKRLNPYDNFIEIKIENNNHQIEYVLFDDYGFYLEEIEENEEIDEDIILENFLILKKSIINELDRLSYDEFLDIMNDESIDIKEFEKIIFDRDLLNQYIRLIDYYLENKNL